MQKVGRNDPCPCGSGLKYKRCCWQKEYAPAPAAKSHDGAVERAVAWLDDRYRKAFHMAFDELLAAHVGVEERAAFAELDAPTMTAIQINFMEWLLAEGTLVVKGVRQRVCDCVLGPGGPLLTPAQRDWLQQLSERPLRLYDVTEVVPGVQINLCDALEIDSPPITVLEQSGSQTLEVGTQAGFRIMSVQRHHELSGAACPFSMLAGPTLAAKLHAAIAAHGHEKDLPSVISGMILHDWLQQYLAPAPMPALVDAYSGEPIMLITDHYAVTEWAKLANALAAQPDVQGDRGNGWARLLDCDDGQTRSTATISAGKRPDRIEIFYKTQRMADAGRVWFEAAAGQSVTYLTREITNPGRAPKDSVAGNAGRSAKLDIDPDTLAEVIEQAIRRSYANWADEPIPALGNKTPREAIATPAGLERVKGLLRSYEDGEERQAAEQGRREFSYQFLWDALSVTP